MLIYNETINIDDTVKDKWVLWMKEFYIPKMLSSGKFTHAKMTRIVVEEEMGGTSFSVQYSCPDQAALEEYQSKLEDVYVANMLAQFPEQFVRFTTVLELVHQQVV